MAQSPLLGNRISLISKKNIRYEGTLYSINEADATVALADVKSYGTEGRDKLEPLSAYVPPQDVIHPYLLFRGCDIKDLHVHERQEPVPQQPANTASPPPPEIKETPKETVESTSEAKENISSSNTAPEDDTQDQKENTTQENTNEENTNEENTIKPQQKRTNPRRQPQQPRQNNLQYNRSYNNTNRRSRKNESRVGTGASLLNRKERGAVDGPNPAKTGDDFDFVTSATEFQSKNIDESNESPYPETNAESCYSKDDFFDSISCDTLDKASGYDTRLRGAAERSLNTETFGAVSLGSWRRRGRGRGRGSWTNKRGGRGTDSQSFKK